MTECVAIYNYLEAEGIKHSILGYRFLASAIMLGMENPSLCIKITDLYDEVAKVHSTNSACVERAVRNSLSSLKMKNKEFITRAVDKLTVDKMEYVELSK